MSECRAETRSAPAVTRIPLTDLHLSAAHQVRHQVDPGIVTRYATAYRQGEALPPIVVAVVDGVPCVVDGWHRVYALQQNKALAVDAIVHENVSQADAAWMAASANLRHGLPLKTRELRKVFSVYVRAGKHREAKGRRSSRFKSYREMATDLGGSVAHETIRRWMQIDFPAIYKMLGGNDQEPHGEYRLLRTDYAGHVRSCLEEIRTALRGVKREDRGALIAEMEKLLAEFTGEMPTLGPWSLPQSTDNNDF